MQLPQLGLLFDDNPIAAIGGPKLFADSRTEANLRPWIVPAAVRAAMGTVILRGMREAPKSEKH